MTASIKPLHKAGPVKDRCGTLCHFQLPRKRLHPPYIRLLYIRFRYQVCLGISPVGGRGKLVIPEPILHNGLLCVLPGVELLYFHLIVHPLCSDQIIGARPADAFLVTSFEPSSIRRKEQTDASPHRPSIMEIAKLAEAVVLVPILAVGVPGLYPVYVSLSCLQKGVGRAIVVVGVC